MTPIYDALILATAEVRVATLLGTPSDRNAALARARTRGISAALLAVVARISVSQVRRVTATPRFGAAPKLALPRVTA